MKRGEVICAALIVLLGAICSGCSSTKRTTKSEHDQTAMQTTQSSRQTQETTEVTQTINRDIKDVTNASIDFTRIEYADGSEVDSVGAVQTGTIKAVTYGRINFNNNRTEQATDTTLIKRTAESTDTLQIITAIETHQQEEQVTDKSRRKTLLVAMVLIILSVICIITPRNKS